MLPTCEDEEGGAVGDEPALVVGQAVGDGPHPVLAHAKAEVALRVLVLLEVAKRLHQGHVAGSQVRGASEEACGSGPSQAVVEETMG